LDERIRDLLAGLGRMFDSIRQEIGLTPQAVEIVIAEDVAAALRSMDGEVVGVESMEDFDLERLGGNVVGKTLFRDEAHEEAVVVLDAAVFCSEVAAARVGEILLTAHELAHALIGQLRAKGGEPMRPTYLPWEVSRWFALFAIEEHRADALA
jgi:hypothetical protein